MPDHFEEVPPQASAGTDGQQFSTPAGRVIAAMDGETRARIAKATVDDAILFSDAITHTLLANILIALEKVNMHLQHGNGITILDEDVT